MTDRVSKAIRKRGEKCSLLKLLEFRGSEMPCCLRCLRLGLSSCKVSLEDSSRCEKCVVDQQGLCDVNGLSAAQIDRVVRNHIDAETELEKAEEEVERAQAKVRRLRKQKKLWAERVSRMLVRGLKSLEELDELEARERAEETQEQKGVEPSGENVPTTSPGWPDLGSPDEFDWDALTSGASGVVGEISSEAAGRS